MINQCFVSLFVLMSALTASANEAYLGASEPVQAIRSNSLDTKPGKKRLTVSSFIEIPTHSFLISTGAGRVDKRKVDQRIQYNPTFGPNIGVRGVYDLWSLSLSKRMSFISDRDAQTYGRSDYDDWRIGYNLTETFFLEAYYQNYRGFYTDLNGQEGLQTTFDRGTQSLADNPAGQSQIISRPDISALNYGLRATFTFPLMPVFKAFSVEDEKENTNWDINFLSKIYYNRLGISGDRPLVPDSTANSFSPIATLKEYWSNTLGIGAGLGVIVPATSRFTFGFDAMLGAGFQRQTNVFVDRSSVVYTVAQEMNSNLYMNWKGVDHGFRFGFYVDALSSKVDDINFDTTSLGVNLIYSYRGLYL